jgi:hypothetical protein
VIGAALQGAVVVTVVAMGMMQPAGREIIDLIAMRSRQYAMLGLSI